MVDTVRTRSALQTLLADNVAGDISAQDVRDFLVSVFPPQFSGVRLTKSTQQDNISDSVITLVTYDGTSYDTDSYADLANEQVTIPAGFADAYYLINSSIGVTNADGLSEISANINLNGSSITVHTKFTGAADLDFVTTTLWSSTVRLLSAGDDITTPVFFVGTSTADIRGGISTYLEVVRLAQVPA